MRRWLIALLPVVVLATGCGGSHHASQRTYHTPYGVQAHSPTFGIPSKTATQPRLTLAPTVEMFDTVAPSALRGLNPRVLAGYTAGNWPTYLPLRRAYPHAIVKSIAIQAGYHAQCLDVESGDAVASQVVGWIRADRRAGFARPCVYANLSEWSAVNGYLVRAGTPRSAYFAWVADWTYRPGLVSGFDATQWTDHAFGRNLDESTVSLAFAGLAPKPKPLLPICFTHRISRSQCAAVKRQVAGYRRAASSSRGAYDARGCVVLSQRIGYFSSALRKHPRTKTTSRRRALTLSRLAYRQRSCSVFDGRVRFYTAKAATTTRAH